MRIPVFARGSNPAIDRPNQRKSESYGIAEVDAFRADWIDPADHSKGILCRAFLYNRERRGRGMPFEWSAGSIQSARKASTSAMP